MNYKTFIFQSEIESNIPDEWFILRIKNWRNNQLINSDWTQLPDSNVINKSDWAMYRQALRDLPQQGNDPKIWIFPVPPT